MKIDFTGQAHCIYKHTTASIVNLDEEISKLVREDGIGHNFHRAFGHMVCAVNHSAEAVADLETVIIQYIEKHGGLDKTDLDKLYAKLEPEMGKQKWVKKIKKKYDEFKFQNGLADDLRVVYQKLAEARRAKSSDETILLIKKAISAQGNILDKLVDRYSIEQLSEKKFEKKKKE